jgi:hypothetical protein
MSYKLFLFTSFLDFEDMLISLGTNIIANDEMWQVNNEGAIEDAGSDYLQVDFANEQLGGGALHMGCVQVCQFLSSKDKQSDICHLGIVQFCQRVQEFWGSSDYQGTITSELRQFNCARSRLTAEFRFEVVYCVLISQCGEVGSAPSITSICVTI